MSLVCRTILCRGMRTKGERPSGLSSPSSDVDCDFHVCILLVEEKEKENLLTIISLVRFDSESVTQDERVSWERIEDKETMKDSWGPDISAPEVDLVEREEGEDTPCDGVGDTPCDVVGDLPFDGGDENESELMLEVERTLVSVCLLCVLCIALQIRRRSNFA